MNENNQRFMAKVLSTTSLDKGINHVYMFKSL